jgi:hypothetical protein
MSYQIAFYKKSKCDYSDLNVVATASQGSTYAPFVLNRNNNSAWVTTSSVDADNTYLDIDMIDYKTVTDVFLLKHNFKNFTVKYWNGTAYVDFSPAIAETTCTAESSHYSVASVLTSKVRIQIYGTQTANQDKYLYQAVLTELIGQFAGWPVIRDLKHSKNKITSKMLSGKNNVLQNVSGISCTLKYDSITSDADLLIIEDLYEQPEGFLVWLCGGSESQFKTVRQGYRLEDLYLMKCQDDYVPEYNSGVYVLGVSLDIKLVEVVE